MQTTIEKLSKITNSLQSMMMLANSAPIEVGNFATFVFYTDRRSEKITKVEGRTFTTENGTVYGITKSGRIYNDFTTVEWIPSFFNEEKPYESHKEYKKRGGEYRHGYVCTIIEGVTELKKQRQYIKNMAITKGDQSYTNPSF